jgi:hypothetical protein
MRHSRKASATKQLENIDAAIDASILTAQEFELRDAVAEGVTATDLLAVFDGALARASRLAERRKQTHPAAASMELTGGAGFTYEDSVVAYYLVALLREEAAPGQSGVVVRVAVQQFGHQEPLDDMIVDTSLEGAPRRLSLQIKRRTTISAAPSNNDFKEIVRRSIDTRAKSNFRPNADRYGFVTEWVADDKFRSLNRLIDWAKSSAVPKDFEGRFAKGAAAAERSLRTELRKLLQLSSSEEEVDFYRHLTALRLDALREGEPRYSECINRLAETLASPDQSPEAMFSVLCNIARNGAGTGKVWTRPVLLADLRDKFRLKAIPNFHQDLQVLADLAARAISDIAADIDGFHIDRSALTTKVETKLAAHRLVNISGLPGSGKSVVLRNVVEKMAQRGPVLFLKSDRLHGVDWTTFAASIGLRHRDAGSLLAEFGAVGAGVLCVDGIDRIKPSQRKIVTDLLHTVMEDPALSNWKVLVTSRDEGLEAFRAWIPVRFYRDRGFGDVAVTLLDDNEAELLSKQKPALRSLLFGAPAVREIARRPFFASVLADEIAGSAGEGGQYPGSESELIAVWWRAGGHEATEGGALMRQRSLLDLAEAGARNLGKSIPLRAVKPETQAQVMPLCDDRILRSTEDGHRVSFTHDIFFEWAFFRLMIDLGNDWPRALSAAGEPPLLGRIVGLLSQHFIARAKNWAATFRLLEVGSLRPQWKRAWLTGPVSSPRFDQHFDEFQTLLAQEEHRLFGKFLVWFQAEHTIPNPMVLNSPHIHMDGATLVRLADQFGWPSDFQTWKRVLSWLVSAAPSLPGALVPDVVELFKVWQNVFGEIKNPISEAIMSTCGMWLAAMDAGPSIWKDLGDEARKSLKENLRFTILRSGRSYPNPAIAIFDRALKDGHLRRTIYAELVGFAPVISDVAPEKLVELARAELIKILPKDEIEREEQSARRHYDALRRIREKPESERTEQEKKALSFPPVLRGIKTYNLDDLAIGTYHHSYFPPSPLHEPFASLFKTRPDLARGLVRDLANHAMQAWRQVHEIERGRFGTPLPIELDFPWGRQQLWGDARTYNWFKGQFGPHGLECAFLALAYWAHKRLDSGVAVDEVIREVVEGHESWAVLGIATSLALEKMHASETVLPIATCQRLWHAEMERVVQEGSPEVDLFGLGLGRQQSPERAAALEYLKSRKSRFRDVRALVPVFALNSNEILRQRFKTALENFPKDLPYSVEEARTSSSRTASFMESARIWAGWGNAENYSMRDLEGQPDAKIVEYRAPTPLPKGTQKRLDKSRLALGDHNILAWASKSLEVGSLRQGLSLSDAIKHVKPRDASGVFTKLVEPGLGALQSAISAVAALATWTTKPKAAEHRWAWNVLARVEKMAEGEDTWPEAKNPWHPALHLIAALKHDLRKAYPRKDSAARLLSLAIHPNEEVAVAAITASLSLHQRHPFFAWIAADLASNLFRKHSTLVNEDGSRDSSGNQAARKETLAGALARYSSGEVRALADPPAAWVKARRRRPTKWEAGERTFWRDPDVYFDSYFAEKVVGSFPIEAWCQDQKFKVAFLSYLDKLTAWTAEKLSPTWRTKADRDDGPEHSQLHLWPLVYADLVARSAPFLSAGEVVKRYLSSFDASQEESLGVIANFADMTATRHVLDAKTVTKDTVALLDHCLSSLLGHRAFVKSSYRAGEIHGFALPQLIKSLLFVAINNAPGAKRFANGDWKDLPVVMPIVDRLVRNAGWAPFVMDTFLTLCERSGAAYPLDGFAEETAAALEAVKESRASWIGLAHPARLAGVVQVLADANYPLTVDQAQRLLSILDALIDLGDRRSAALEQSEVFRNTQKPS